MSNSKFGDSYLYSLALSLNDSEETDETRGLSDENSFSPVDHLIPGWKGHTIISNKALDFSKIIKDICLDVKKNFWSLKDSNYTTKSQIYDEFICYSVKNGLICHEIDSVNSFWKHLLDEYSRHSSVLNDFVTHYADKVSLLFIYKIKFILELCNGIDIAITTNDIINSSNVISKTFQKRATTKINARTLRPNKYSWYRPSAEIAQKIYKMKSSIIDISISEKTKIENYLKDSAIKTGEEDFSHALSHESFGLLANHLMINVPKWLKGKINSTAGSGRGLQIVNCKMQGSHLNSMSLSHWLAQNSCINEKWDSLICPDIIDDELSNDDFIRYTHELQFMIYLVNFAKIHQLPIIEFVSATMRQSSSSSQRKQEQINLFQTSTDKVYDRILLNVESPKKNPHNHLLRNIKASISSLTADGSLTVMTNQNLFVHSNRQATERLLKDLKLDVYLNFENLKGKGELAQHVYIFSKKNHLNASEDIFTQVEEYENSSKETCLSFRFSGELEVFGNFKTVVDKFFSFIADKKVDTAPIYRENILDSQVLFEFFRDPIIDGSLLSAASDLSKETHPTFRKNIFKSCTLLSEFFHIDAVTQKEESTAFTLGMFPVTNKMEDRFKYLLIVNMTSQRDIKLELTTGDQYLAKKSEYGTYCYQYYGLTPKVPGINLNLFKMFFSSQVGLQVIQMCLTKPASIKSQLANLLVPKFFEAPGALNKVNEHIVKPLERMTQRQDQLKAESPAEFLSYLDAISSTISTLAAKYPWDIMGRLCYLKNNLVTCSEELKINTTHSSLVDFNNPQLFTPLISSPSQPLMKHADISFKFVDNSLTAKLDKVSIKAHPENENVVFLVLSVAGVDVVEFYAHRDVLRFLKFLFSKLIGYPIKQIMNGTKCPSEECITSVVKSFSGLEKDFSKLHLWCDTHITQILTRQINS